MSAVRFYYDNFVSDATFLGAYGQDDFFPAQNITDPRTTKVFRTGQEFTRGKVFYGLDQPKSANTCIIRLNAVDPLFPQRKISARGGNDYSPTMVSNRAQNLPSEYFNLFDFFLESNFIIQNRANTPEFTYWSLNADLQEGESFVEVPKIFLGEQALGLENIGIDYGWSLATNSLDKISKNRYGQKFIDKVINQRVLSLAIRLIDKDELDIFMDIFETVGTHRPLWVVIDPDEIILNTKERFIVYGYFTAVPTITNNVFSHYDLELEIEEII